MAAVLTVAQTAQAQSAQFAAVWLWDTITWAPVGAPLRAHTLTVTQLAFSPCGGRLLSVSRDRSLAVYERNADGALPSPCTLAHQEMYRGYGSGLRLRLPGGSCRSNVLGLLYQSCRVCLEWAG